jgi:hypothetical protein
VFTRAACAAACVGEQGASGRIDQAQAATWTGAVNSSIGDRLTTRRVDPHLHLGAQYGWFIEEFFEDAKSSLGMAQDETRSWVGWHHHMSLVAMAHLFLTLTRRDLGKKRRS